MTARLTPGACPRGILGILGRLDVLRRAIGPLVLLAALAGLGRPALAVDATPLLHASGAWLRLPHPGAHTAAVYMTLRNDGKTPLDIVGVDVAGAKRAEVHATTRAPGGVMGMQPLPHLVVAPGGTVELAPGGVHVMVFDLIPPPPAGGEVRVMLHLADGRQVMVPCQARS